MNEQTNPLIITGSHADVLLDIAAVPRCCNYDFMAIGLDAVDKYAWPVKWCATYHLADIPQIIERRTKLIGRVDFEIICHEKNENVAMAIADWWKPSGSSALLGVQAALLLGYERIILCGCPLTGRNEKSTDYSTFRDGWKERTKELAGCVRSMSGWTRDFLGSPDEQWLIGGVPCPR
ncbi:MAG: hypothetical protein M0P74_00805 [Syntrophales bacterium]|jgi:hypothetical protein|nr:hypothetical protein [Syntrophales bacterium]